MYSRIRFAMMQRGSEKEARMRIPISYIIEAGAPGWPGNEVYETEYHIPLSYTTTENTDQLKGFVPGV